MREEYDFSSGRKNPYAKRLKRQITINIDSDTIDYFKGQSEGNGGEEGCSFLLERVRSPAVFAPAFSVTEKTLGSRSASPKYSRASLSD
jgi:hypothetical protein